MNDLWLKALILVVVFAAVVFLVERLTASLVGKRIESRAINQRLDLIARGVPRDAAMQMLRRRATNIPEWMPPGLRGLAIWLEKMLMAAGVTMDTGRLMWLLVAAPFALFLLCLALVSAIGGGIGFGRIVLLAVISFMIGAGIP